MEGPRYAPQQRRDLRIFPRRQPGPYTATTENALAATSRKVKQCFIPRVIGQGFIETFSTTVILFIRPWRQF
jgi:hypothetical protein